MTSADDASLRRLGEDLSGRIVVAGDDEWDSARGAFNLLVDQRPAAVVLPSDADDVAVTLRFAAQHGLRVAPQTTGHNAGPLGDLSGTLLLRTAALSDVRIDPGARLAQVGAGVRWEAVVPGCSELGLAPLHGSSPTVGVTGYSLGGGIGPYARKWGLQANSLTAIDMVAPDGHRLRASADEEPDLFWALRGGGGNFGVVTALEFRLHEVGEVYAGAFFFPFDRASEVLGAWNEWQAHTPDEVTSIGRLLQFPPLEIVPEPLRGNSFAIVDVAYVGGESDGAELVAPLRDLGPAMDTFATMPPVGLTMLHMDPQEPVPAVTGHMLLGDLPAEGIEQFVAVAGPGSGSMLTAVELRQTGGALSRADPSHGALASVPGSFAMFAVGSPFDADQARALEAQITRITDAMEPYDAGRTLNFSEQAGDTAAGFSAEAYERLRAVRKAYDPDGVMHANHPIPADAPA